MFGNNYLCRVSVYPHILSASQQGQKAFAVLIDPDKSKPASLEQLLKLTGQCRVDYFLLGGSHLSRDGMEECISYLKANSDIPVILFPGSIMQINEQADALLFLSLISGRNPELLIGQHVTAAPYLKSSSLEIISTGYILVDGGRPTTASYISNTQPIPHDKPSIAVSTAMAGEMLGMKLIYMDAGSGAQQAVSAKMIKQVKANINIPLIVGGGVRSPEQAESHINAGADVVVVGNAIEKDPLLLSEISYAIHSGNKVKR